jgi:hypothetical protein
VDKLASARGQEEAQGRRRELISRVTAGLPEAHRGIAGDVVEGILARGVIAFGEGSDIGATALALTTQLRAVHPTLFAAPAGSRSARPVGPDGKKNWDGVDSFEQVLEEEIQDMPDDVVRRITRGQKSSDADRPMIPRALFQRPATG